MESGIVTIAKAGISAILNADCTIICGANPKNSRFDPGKSLVSQINMEETLLTRFDWIFVMRDNIDGTKDKSIAESIWEDEDLIEELVPLTLFKKYIKYCQKFKPRVSLEARDAINNFYVEIRNKSINSEGLEGMPIVPRHLKGLRRMAEASAKIRLSKEVLKEDAEIAIEVFKSSLIKLGMEEGGTIDFARLGPGKSVNKKMKMKGLLEIVEKLSKNEPFIEEESIMFEASRLGLDLTEVKQLLSDLHKEGELYNPRYNVWARTK
jgi:replicative DNA helicase Mcm